MVTLKHAGRFEVKEFKVAGSNHQSKRHSLTMTKSGIRARDLTVQEPGGRSHPYFNNLSQQGHHMPQSLIVVTRIKFSAPIPPILPLLISHADVRYLYPIISSQQHDVPTAFRFQLRLSSVNLYKLNIPS